jgi:hypothetical protein
MLVTTAWINSEEAQSEYRVVSQLSHSMAEEAMRFWDGRPQDGIVIGRDIPSRAIAKLLSRTIIYQPIEGGRDLKVHLAGTSIRRRFGRDITGAKMSELFVPEEFPVRYKTMMETVESNEPRMATIVHRAGPVEILRLELLMLPARSPDGSEIWPLVFCFYF